ncbi:MAG: LysR substrate-binding domain-containing protein [Pseudomonadota bacterium]
MRSDDITLAQLRALLAVRQEGSMTAASVKLGVTQPVLTRSLQQLERQMGVTLLRRSSRGAVLNEYGEALVARARVVDQELKRAFDEIGQMQGRLSGSVTIACSHIPMMLFVPEAIGQLQQNFPDVEVRIIEGVYPQVLEEFRQGVLDFAIGPVPERGLGRDYKAARMLKADMAIAVRKGHSHAKAKSLAELKDLRWMIAGPMEGPGGLVKEVFAENGIQQPATPIYLDTVWAAMEVVKHSNLVALIPKMLVELASDEIDIITVAENIEPIRIDVITAKMAILTPAARALLSAVRASAMSWQNRADGAASRQVAA